jgi:hypothetical protein
MTRDELKYEMRPSQIEQVTFMHRYPEFQPVRDLLETLLFQQALRKGEAWMQRRSEVAAQPNVLR